MRDFGCKKADLSLKYRLGLEHALAKADFLNVPDLVTVQAFAIFLFLVRRYKSPTYVWMMTGLVIRIGQALGLHRGGSHFKNFTPYEAEIRRRVWWALCALDI
jgi:Fungal specific transcription factor domain